MMGNTPEGVPPPAACWPDTTALASPVLARLPHIGLARWTKRGDSGNVSSAMNVVKAVMLSGTEVKWHIGR